MFALVQMLALGCGDATSTDAERGQTPSNSTDASGASDMSGDASSTRPESADGGAGTVDAGGVESEDGASDAELVEDTDALSVFPSDLPVITEINDDVGLSEFFPDAVGPEPGDSEERPSDAEGVSPDSETIEDTSEGAVSDAGDGEGDAVEIEVDGAGDAVEIEVDGAVDAVEIEVDGDVSPEPGDSAEGDADVAEEPDTFLADCDNLGVVPSWSGTFEGAIEYHIPEALEELFYPPDGILIVGGILSFDIECVDSKLIVSGDMDGTANVSGEGDFPFQVKLAGYFNPETGLLNAALVEGMVVLYELAEIYFSGDFTGTLTDDVFNGNWTGNYDGTNFPLPPGDEPVADGLGTWTAQGD